MQMYQILHDLLFNINYIKSDYNQLAIRITLHKEFHILVSSCFLKLFYNILFVNTRTVPTNAKVKISVCSEQNQAYSIVKGLSDFIMFFL